ncbi:MAG: FKBP-type peptidyl-prolyl cis-trans isomerase [Vicingaceae bacterium]|nr:FKBP-type peptidyl-prolyl cis-trans isomerase [Vicingaceae bacterium]
MKKILIILFSIPSLLFAQQDSIFYDTGELMNISYLNESGVIKSRTYFYKTGEFKGESYYDNQGVLLDGYTLNTSGDTIDKSDIPLFKKQPKMNLNDIKWKKKKSGISIFIEKKGDGKKIEKGDEVEVWYIGYFEDGSQFDNSDITNYKLNFIIGSGLMLKSFEDGLLEFKDGSSGYIFIPYKLGYGNKVAGNLPAKSNLIYYVKPTIKNK